MVNYAYGKIYKITSQQTNKIYIGSSAQNYLSSRMRNHRKAFKSWKNGNGSYVTSFELVKFSDAQIVLIENFSCNSNEELRKREEYHRKKHQSFCVNKLRCYRNKSDDVKKWRLNNKDKIKAMDKRKYTKHKGKILESRKQYYLDNKRNISNYKKQIYNKSKKKISCWCGKSYVYASLINKTAHEKTKWHKKCLQNNILELKIEIEQQSRLRKDKFEAHLKKFNATDNKIMKLIYKEENHE